MLGFFEDRVVDKEKDIDQNEKNLDAQLERENLFEEERL